jgi:RHS repeat-associated protein
MAHAATDTSPKFDVYRYNGIVLAKQSNGSYTTQEYVRGYEYVDTVTAEQLEAGIDYTYPTTPPTTDYYTDFGVLAVPEGTNLNLTENAAWNDKLTETGVKASCGLASAMKPSDGGGSLYHQKVHGSSTVRLQKNAEDCGCSGSNPGQGEASNSPGGGVDLNLSMGNAESSGLSGSGGVLSLKADQPSPDLSARSLVAYHGIAGAGSPVMLRQDGGGAIQQVETPMALADLVDVSGGYEIRFFKQGQFTPGSGSTSAVPTGNASVVTRITSAGTGSLTIEKSGLNVHPSKVVYTWIDTPGEPGWAMEHREADETVLRKQIRSEKTESNGDVIQTEILLEGDGSVASRIARRFRNLGGSWYLVEERRGLVGAERVSTKSYIEDDQDPNYRKLASETDADGSWTRFEYDAEGRESKRVGPWLDSAPTDPESESRTRVTTYNDTYTSGNLTVRTVTVSDYVLGQEVARQVEDTVFGSVDRRVIRSNRTVSTSSSAVLVTRTVYSGGLPATTTHPDGTISTEVYVTAPLPGNDAVEWARGRKVITRTLFRGTTDSQNGERTRIISDIVTGIQIRRTVEQLVGGTPYLLSREETVEVSSDWQPQRILFADGTAEVRQYGCCGLESVLDRNGGTTFYEYDALKRVTVTTRSGISTHKGFDAAGREKSEWLTSMAGGGNLIRTLRVYRPDGTLASETRPGFGTSNHSIEPLTSGGVRRRIIHSDAERIEDFHRDGRLMERSGAAASPVRIVYGVNSLGLWSKTIRLDSQAGTDEWLNQQTDWLNRANRTEFAPGTANATAEYNALGQLVKESDPDGVVTLHGYNALGERALTAIDANGSGVLDIDGSDRATQTNTTYTGNGTATRVTTVTQYPGGGGPPIVSTRSELIDGSQIVETRAGVTTTTDIDTDPETATTTETITHPDTTQTVRVTVAGRLQSETRLDTGGGTLVSTTFGYDAFGRLGNQTVSGSGTTVTTYHPNTDLVHTVTTPNPGDGTGPKVTTYAYDERGRRTVVTLPDGSTQTTEYYPTGSIKKTYGSQTYPVDYTYDPHGRMLTMTTQGATGNATTTWHHDPARGWLTFKEYADGQGPTYTYTPAGRLDTRTWARGITTTYRYNGAGELRNLTYSDGTPGITSITYDGLGRRSVVTEDNRTRSFTYSPDGQTSTETVDNWMWAGSNWTVTVGQDALLRRGNLTVSTRTNGGTPHSYTVNSTYSPLTGRLANIEVEGINFAYSWVERLNQVQQVAGAGMTATRQFDALGRLDRIENVQPGGAVLSRHDYRYDSLNRRDQASREDGTAWRYGYDSLGQVTSGVRQTEGGTPLPGFEFGYAFDNIGNRLSATTNGRSEWYGSYGEVSLLNLYKNRQHAPAFDVVGKADQGSTVTLLSPLAGDPPLPTSRLGSWFAGEMPVDNSIGPVFGNATVVAVKKNAGPNGADVVSTLSKTDRVGPATEDFSYDADGNLLSDGFWNYTWDGENRLSGMSPKPGLEPFVGARMWFGYDSDSRRAEKQRQRWDDQAGEWMDYISAMHFAYDRWNLVAEWESDHIDRRYVWGPDLSGTLQGAGGIGGLLWMELEGQSFAPFYDGNGNVMGLLPVAGGGTLRRYEYGPFGEPLQLVEEDPAFDQNPFRFSTKYRDHESGLYYYGYRFYIAESGRWLNRDPIEERGGVNLFATVANSIVGRIDPLGLSVCDGCDQQPKGTRSFIILSTSPCIGGRTLAEMRGAIAAPYAAAGGLSAASSLPITTTSASRPVASAVTDTVISAVATASTGVSYESGLVGMGQSAIRTVEQMFQGPTYLCIEIECRKCKCCLLFSKTWEKTRKRVQSSFTQTNWTPEFVAEQAEGAANQCEE